MNTTCNKCDFLVNHATQFCGCGCHVVPVHQKSDIEILDKNIKRLEEAHKVLQSNYSDHWGKLEELDKKVGDFGNLWEEMTEITNGLEIFYKGVNERIDKLEAYRQAALNQVYLFQTDMVSLKEKVDGLMKRVPEAIFYSLGSGGGSSGKEIPAGKPGQSLKEVNGQYIWVDPKKTNCVVSHPADRRCEGCCHIPF